MDEEDIPLNSLYNLNLNWDSEETIKQQVNKLRRLYEKIFNKTFRD